MLRASFYSHGKFFTYFFVLASSVVSGLLITSNAYSQNVEEITVIGVKDTSTVRTEETLVSPPDTASLLKSMPGANVNKNGELTGIAQYRGMYGDRINISINGSHISSGGPNAMDAPLHYAPVALLESLTIQRGIAPVSSGQETIGGHVEAVTYKGDFGVSNKLQFTSRVYLGGQSVNDGSVGSAFVTLANLNHILRASLMKEDGGDSEFGDGLIRPSEYDRERFDLGYSYTSGNHLVHFDYARNETGDAGTASLPMDIKLVDSDLISTSYQWQKDNLTITAKASFNDIEHEMTNFHLRRPPQGNMMVPGPMLYREVLATGENSGFLLQAEHDTVNGIWRYGVDGHYAQHDALISNPNAAAFRIDNFKDVERNITGLFIERELNLSERLALETGLRVNRVEMNAGRVTVNLNPMNLTMGMPVMMNSMAGMLADQFNASARSATDTNVDWFARFNYEMSRDLVGYVGLARKSRSASYQERYLWLPLESTGGLADGFNYIGNLNLEAEVAHELELGFDLEGRGYSLYPRLFYKQVDDYIQGTTSSNMGALMFSQMMGNMGMGLGTMLQFNNVEASFYGFDFESNFELSSRLNLRANLSLVRGKREDINDNLYRVTPNNLLIALDYTANNWVASLESIAYMKQEKVSVTNAESETPGYAVINAVSRFNMSDTLEFGFGINNIFDKSYKDHLAGYNRAFNEDISARDRLPGLGRNIYARLIWNY